MKRLLIACLLAVLAAPAFAVIGTVDDVPAATLLLPYFEVDIDNPDGVTTLMSINNASATAVLAHVVLWTDLSVHVIDFNVYLTGYDVQTINLRDIIVHGNLPITASAGQDPGDTISNKGPASQDINFASCNTYFPYVNPALNQTYREHTQWALTGQPSPHFNWDGDCGGIDHGDNIARGYVTVDTVNGCSTDFPDDANYWVFGTTSTQNVLWGDYFYVNPGENFAQGETLVHIEAFEQPNPDLYTFYYRYSYDAGVPGADRREGLGNAFAVRYANGGSFDGGTDLLVWRDSKVTVEQGGYCGDFPPPFPLGQSQVVVFDEEENFEIPETCTLSPCGDEEFLIPFPWETQRTQVGSSKLPTSYDFGWIFLNLNSSVVNTQVPIDLGYLMQNWVTVTMDAQGRFSVGFDAIQLGNVTDPATAPDPFIGF